MREPVTCPTPLWRWSVFELEMLRASPWLNDGLRRNSTKHFAFLRAHADSTCRYFDWLDEFSFEICETDISSGEVLNYLEKIPALYDKMVLDMADEPYSVKF